MILLRRAAGADEAVGLLIDFDYAELLLLENSPIPESVSDDGLDESYEPPVKHFRTVSFYLSY